jgi:DNA polymerase-3 subunit delta'
MSAAALITFADVRGHERACAGLRAAVTAGRLPHALLFAGPDGVGKRSVALALAAWAQCEGGVDDACGGCAACRQVAAGTHPDVQLVGVPQGKKEIGVERARDVKRFVQLKPLRDRFKLAVIDDAHMLTVAAQNALLKTLEEPPDRSCLILVANNPDALLPTVRSRCQRVLFAPLPRAAVVTVLTERLGLAAAVAERLAAVAEGSPGRALVLSRVCAEDDGQAALPPLAGLRDARYQRLMQVAQALGRPEADTAVKLELLLLQARDAVVHALETDPAAVRPALARADLVHEAWTSLRRGNPNRQLLLEALLLRVGRVA